MNVRDRELFDELLNRQNKIEIAIMGDDQLGVKGLAKRQVDDEKLQEKILKSLSDIQSNQVEMSDKLDKHYKLINDHGDRLKILESFYNVWKKLGTLKRRTILAIGTLMAGATSLVTFWEKIKSYIIHLFDK